MPTLVALLRAAMGMDLLIMFPFVRGHRMPPLLHIGWLRAIQYKLPAPGSTEARRVRTDWADLADMGDLGF